MKFLATTLLFCLIAWPACAPGQSLQAIPGPSDSQCVIDHARAIPAFAKPQLEALCQEIRNFRNSEMVILVVNDVGNRDPDQFAIDYFNRHGIGNAKDNNGILVFAALNNRRARIVLGDGLLSEENNRKSTEVAEDFMIPRFRRNDIAGAMFGGAFGSARYVLGYEDLATNIPEGALDREDERLKRSDTGQQRRKLAFWWFMGGGLLVGTGVIVAVGRYRVRYGSRDCEQCHSKMVMLDEQRDDSFLDPPQVIEERLGSVDYDVWACSSCDNATKYRYGTFFTRYSTCPRCRYKTKSKVSRTIRAATTTRRGKVRVTESCANCTYHNVYTYSTPKKPKPSSSSGGWSSSGSWGGGGGFSGGGFSGGGGGFSSGGGGGASW